ncbi:MAG: anti-FecI sigma factor, FecR [Gammaproteobacteria bacterium]|nr:anti-FecI sigma factor, FecR [Gammaproteobacteria bacterium]
MTFVALSAVVGGAFALHHYLTPTPRALRFADGTEVFYLSDTRIEPSGSYPQSREIRVDGDAFIRASAGAQPLIVRSRLMVLTVTGSSALRVTAYAKDSGEEAQVLYGQVGAKKAYPSPQSEPDSLVGGQEVMVNETIDLQEKETTDLARLRSWSAALVASVRIR